MRCNQKRKARLATANHNSESFSFKDNSIEEIKADGKTATIMDTLHISRSFPVAKLKFHAAQCIPPNKAAVSPSAATEPVFISQFFFQVNPLVPDWDSFVEPSTSEFGHRVPMKRNCQRDGSIIRLIPP